MRRKYFQLVKSRGEEKLQYECQLLNTNLLEATAFENQKHIDLLINKLFLDHHHKLVINKAMNLYRNNKYLNKVSSLSEREKVQKREKLNFLIGKFKQNTINRESINLEDFKTNSKKFLSNLEKQILKIMEEKKIKERIKINTLSNKYKIKIGNLQNNLELEANSFLNHLNEIKFALIFKKNHSQLNLLSEKEKNYLMEQITVNILKYKHLIIKN
jgi:hypothetical protein